MIASKPARTIPRGPVAAALALALALTLPVLTRPAGAGPEGGGARDRYIAIFHEQAAIDPNGGTGSVAERRSAVVDALKATAAGSQGPVLSLLTEHEAAGRASSIESLWIVNAIAFEAEAAVADIVEDRPEVASVQLNEQVFIHSPQPAAPVPPVGTVEWNVDRINAPDVWADGVTGANAVVATIDSGAAHTHPAIAAQYRGTCGGTHDCSWFDAVDGAAVPYDDLGHGTHVLGSLVGGDGLGAGGNDIGVAPGAKWIAAKAFNNAGAGLLTWLLASFEWVLAPDGNPANAPDVVNASWSFGKCVVPFGFDPASPLILNTLRAAEIMPVFAIGNLGPLPGTAESPGDLELAFGVGATDHNDGVASFSSRGPACDPSVGIKPDVTAPGLSVRSSVPGGGYELKSGTSMAAPHAAGTAALMLQAAGGAVPGIVNTLETLIRNTAVDLGSSGADHEFGFGRVDAAAAVALAAKTGVLTGTVLATGCRPTAGATVRLTSTTDPSDVREVAADASGIYRFPHLDGTYTVQVQEAFGYAVPSGAVTIAVPNATAVVQNLSPSALPCGTITGTVTRVESGEALEGMQVSVPATPIAPVTAGAGGVYTISDVPQGTYTVKAAADRCAKPSSATATVVVPGAVSVTQNFAIEAKRDAFGHFCMLAPGAYIPGREIVNLGGDDRFATVTLPFTFSFYGAGYSTVHVATNGFLRFGSSGSTEHANGPIPSATSPNLAVYPFWDDLDVGAASLVRTRDLGDAFVIEWRNAAFRYAPGDRVSFEAILHRNGDIEFQYDSGTGIASNGGSATIGIENGSGGDALQFSADDDGATPLGAGIVISRAGSPGLLTGTVTDGTSPIAGATVTAAAGGVSRMTRTDATGRYRLWLQAGTYALGASKFAHASASSSATVTAGATATASFTLTPLALHRLSGTITETATSLPVDDVTVQVNVDPEDVSPVRTNASGVYELFLPDGTYTVTVAPTGRCQGTVTGTTTIAGVDQTYNASTTVKRDAFGYSCRELDAAPIAWTEVANLSLRGDDAYKRVTLPFVFAFYGETYSQAFVSTNGFLRFGKESTEPLNDQIPSLREPNNAVYPFWDDLFMDTKSDVFVKRLESGSSTVAYGIEWRNANFRNAAWARGTYEVILHADGRIDMVYPSGAGDIVRGSSATTGIEIGGGTTALRYGFNTPALKPGLRVSYRPERHPLSGTVTDAVTGDPIFGATVTAAGATTLTATTDSAGAYTLLLPEDSYSVTASAFGYGPETVSGLAVTAPVSQSFALTASPVYTISGVVTDSGDASPLGGVTVEVDDPNIAPAVTDPLGAYAISVPAGTYTVTAGGRCAGSVSAGPLSITANAVQNLSIATLKDASYVCEDTTELLQLAATLPVLTTVNPVTHDDRWIPLPLPFEFPIYDTTSRLAFISTNGFVEFDLPGQPTDPVGLLGSDTPPPASDPCHGTATCIPSASRPNAAIYPFWDDLVADQATKISVGLLGLDGMVVQWDFARFKGDTAGTDPAQRLIVQAVFQSNGDVDYQYLQVPGTLPSGARPVVGIEKGDGSKGLQYGLSLDDPLRVRFRYLGPS